MPGNGSIYRFLKTFQSCLLAVNLIFWTLVSNTFSAWQIGDLNQDELPKELAEKIKVAYERGQLVLFGERVYYQNIQYNHSIPDWILNALPTQGTPTVLTFLVNFSASPSLTPVGTNQQQAEDIAVRQLKQLKPGNLDHIRKPYRRQLIKQLFAKGAAVVIDGHYCYIADGFNESHQAIYQALEAGLNQYSGQLSGNTLWIAQSHSPDSPLTFSPVSVAIGRTAPNFCPSPQQQPCGQSSSSDDDGSIADMNEVQAPTLLVPVLQQPPLLESPLNSLPRRLIPGDIDRVRNILARAFIKTLMYQGYIVVHDRFFYSSFLLNIHRIHEVIGNGPDQGQFPSSKFLWIAAQSPTGGNLWIPLQIPLTASSVFSQTADMIPFVRVWIGDLTKLIHDNSTAGMLVKHYLLANQAVIFQGKLYLPLGAIVESHTYQTLFYLYQSALNHTFLGEQPPEDFLWVYQQTLQGQMFVPVLFTEQLPPPISLTMTEQVTYSPFLQAILPAAQPMSQQMSPVNTASGSQASAKSSEGKPKNKQDKKMEEKKKPKKNQSKSGQKETSHENEQTESPLPATEVDMQHLATTVAKILHARTQGNIKTTGSTSGSVHYHLQLQKNTIINQNYYPPNNQNERSGEPQQPRKRKHSPDKNALKSAPKKLPEDSLPQALEDPVGTAITAGKYILGASLTGLGLYAAYKIINGFYSVATDSSVLEKTPQKSGQPSKVFHPEPVQERSGSITSTPASLHTPVSSTSTKKSVATASIMPVESTAIPEESLIMVSKQEWLKTNFKSPEIYQLIDELYDTPSMVLTPVIADWKTEHSTDAFPDIAKKYRKREFSDGDKQLTFLPLIKKNVFSGLPLQRQKRLLENIWPYIQPLSDNNQLPPLDFFHWLMLLCGEPEQRSKLKCYASASKLLETQWRQSREALLLYDSYLIMAEEPQKAQWIMMAGWPVLRRNALATKPMLIPVVHDRKNLLLQRPVNLSNGRLWNLNQAGLPDRHGGDQINIMTAWLRWRPVRDSDFLSMDTEAPLYHMFNYATVILFAEKAGAYGVISNNQLIAPEKSLHNALSHDILNVKCPELHTESAIERCREIWSVSPKEALIYQRIMKDARVRDLKLPYYRLVREDDQGEAFLTTDKALTRQIIKEIPPGNESQRILAFNHLTRFDQLSTGLTRKVLKAYINALIQQQVTPSDLILHFSMLSMRCGVADCQEVVNLCYSRDFNAALEYPPDTIMDYAMHYTSQGVPEEYPEHVGRSCRPLPMLVLNRNKQGVLDFIYFPIGQLIEDGKPRGLLISNIFRLSSTIRVPLKQYLAPDQQAISYVTPTRIAQFFLPPDLDRGLYSLEIDNTSEKGTFFSIDFTSATVAMTCIYEQTTVPLMKDKQASNPAEWDDADDLNSNEERPEDSSWEPDRE